MLVPVLGGPEEGLVSWIEVPSDLAEGRRTGTPAPELSGLVVPTSPPSLREPTPALGLLSRMLARLARWVPFVVARPAREDA
jgi:hypothetical protein